MNPGAKLAVAAVVVAFVGTLIASSLKSPDDESSARGDGAPSGTSLADLATPDEYRLWSDRGCITCHGPEARGTPLGPDLTRVVPLYLAKFGSRDAARAALAAHMLDPQRSVKLRDDGEVFPNPMPPLEKLFGGKREEAPVLADLLLRLAR